MTIIIKHNNTIDNKLKIEQRKNWSSEVFFTKIVIWLSEYFVGTIIPDGW